MCIFSVSFSIVQNGIEMRFIFLERGIYQGCSLLPYLFIICAEGLSSLIKRKENQRLIHDCKIAWRAPPISYLFFANDILFFFKASEVGGNHIKECLEVYKFPKVIHFLQQKYIRGITSKNSSTFSSPGKR